MVVKERLLAIPGLNLYSIINDMSEYEINRYIGLLNTFVEHFHSQEETIRTALKIKDYSLLSSTLRIIMGTLTSIHANDLLNEFKQQINSLGNTDLEREYNYESIEAGITALLSSASTFAIDIQLINLRVEPEEPIPALESIVESKKEIIDILAVDDSAFFLQTLKAMFQGQNYKMAFIKSGQDALCYLTNHAPRVIILDIEMGDINGFDLANKIRENGIKTPIIFMTGNSNKENVIRAMQVGGNDFIVKPINKENALIRVKKQLGCEMS
jgi:CheY-like chemotaxis protein